MQPQPLDHAISTADLVSAFDVSQEESKCTLCDLIMSVAQVGGALSFCWALHMVL